MDAFRWSLFFGCLCLNVFYTDASSWTINVPTTVKGLLGSCVVIPCSYNYPEKGKEATKFTGIWKDDSHIIYHPNETKIGSQYQGRTELGDVENKYCSLKINALQESDQGSFYFRVEMEGYNKYSFLSNTVSISTVADEKVTLSVSETVEGQAVKASCSVFPVCPHFPPAFSWSHPGEKHSHPVKFEDGQWKATASLTFRSTSADHNKTLQCTAHYHKGGQQVAAKVLKVKYAPVNVKIDSKTEVTEGETVRLKCSSDAHPPASYEWYNGTGALVYHGSTYVIPNVTRHLEALYCTAVNTLGRRNSSPVWLSVLFVPEITTLSSCFPQGDTVKCMCIVDCRPPCLVHFAVSDRVLPGTKIERHGIVTFGMLETESASYTFVHCLANNTVGTANRTLPFPVNDKMQILSIALGIGVAVVLMILSLAVVFFKKRGRTSAARPSPNIPANTGCDSERTSATRKGAHYDGHNHYSNSYDHVYGNLAHCNDAVYGNI